MNIQEIIESRRPVLVEGSMYDRLKRLAGGFFDSDLGHLGLIFSEEGRSALRDAYGDYVKAARESSLPIVLFTPTWRANQLRVARSRYAERNVNDEAVKFVRDFRDEILPNGRSMVFVGGLMGCKNDCYDPAQALSVVDSAAFHQKQVDQLVATGVDFLFASTLPSVSEAKGIARAIAATGAQYILSFVVDSSGSVLDGTPLNAAIKEVDASVDAKPAGYFVNCVHPEILLTGLLELDWGPEKGRLVGVQGNTSRQDPRTFDSLGELDTESPSDFAVATMKLRSTFQLSFLGGCCGTDPGHIREIGKSLVE